jgi:hypothetical protein
VHRINCADLPSSEQRVHKCVAVAKEVVTMAYGQVINKTENVADRQVVLGLSAVGGDVIGVLRRGRVAFERALALSRECDHVKEFKRVSPAMYRCS